jgi:hypothetical protein
MTAKRQTHAIDQIPETTNREQLAPRLPALPSVEHIQQELASATNLNDFFGKDGIFARLFATTIEQMLAAELTAHLGYTPYATEGRNSGNSRNGKRTRSLRTSAGDTTITVPRDRNGTFQSPLLEPYQSSTSELEDKIIGLYAKGVSARDIQETLKHLYGVEVSAATISTVTDKVWSLVEAWQNRPLAALYPIVYLDAIHLKLRRDGRVQTTAVYIVLGIDLEGQRHVLGHWVGDGAEGANFLNERGDGSADARRAGYLHRLCGWVDGFQGGDTSGVPAHPAAALHRPPGALKPELRELERPQSVRARSTDDLSGTDARGRREQATGGLRGVEQQLSGRTAWVGNALGGSGDDVRVWGRDPTADLHHEHDRGVQPAVAQGDEDQGLVPECGGGAQAESELVTRDITRKWTMPPQDWARIRNQLAIRFAGRFPAE